MSWVERVPTAMGRDFKPGGLAGWVMARLRRTSSHSRRMTILERISLGPRQSLAMVEADGRRILVATSPEGTPAFYALDALPGRQRAQVKDPVSRERVSW